MTDQSPYDDLLKALKAARTPSCRLALAHRVQRAREDRGMYDGILALPLSEDVRTLLALAILKEIKND